MSDKQTLENIKKLREITGVGFKDCKLAIDENGGDLEKSISEYLPRPFSKENNEEIVAVVKGIIEEVRKRGDEALYEMTERFDGSRPRTLSVGRQEMENALEQISPELRAALEKAAENVRTYYSKHDLSGQEIIRDGMSIKSRLLPHEAAPQSPHKKVAV